MGFYDIDKEERDRLVGRINSEILNDILSGDQSHLLRYFSDEDTYIRKSAYLAIGKIYQSQRADLPVIINVLHELAGHNDSRVRQTAVNAAGEIGKSDFDVVRHFFDSGLFDKHHSVRNAVIGSMKKMGEKNPRPVLEWSALYLHHPDKEIRREICHGIELRGRTHPQDVLPLLRELQFDQTRRVRWTVVHVIGQISYKKGCLETVVAAICGWENQDLVKDALAEIVDVHDRYRNFSFYTQQQAVDYIRQHAGGLAADLRF